MAARSVNTITASLESGARSKKIDCAKTPAYFRSVKILLASCAIFAILAAALSGAEPKIADDKKTQSDSTSTVPPFPPARTEESGGLKSKHKPEVNAKSEASALDKSSDTAESSPDNKSGSSKPAGAAWPTGLEAAKLRARNENHPLLVRAGATWCGPCKALEEELAEPQVQQELRRWTLVYIDVDAAPDEARSLNIGAIPALRLINARGKVVASLAGVEPTAELLAWLHENFDRAGGKVNPILVAKGAPTPGEVKKLLEMFQLPDPVDREAAIRRLGPFPKAAAGRAIEAMAKGKLSTRLAVLELLSQWKAPIAELDPWRPETVSPERTAALQKWADALPADAEFKPTPLTKAADADARRQLQRLAQATDEEADALSERLVRLGPALTPLVAAALKEVNADVARQRLLALRYRLVASDALSLSWPGGLSRLASADPAVRRHAAEELVERATNDDEPLLLELFSDSDPMIRELSLRGLISVGGADATDALVKLLDDPEPNVRAAVLKALATNPSKRLVPAIAKYIKGEKDPDLLVHAIRFLKNAPNDASTDCLLELLDHPVWQVRAEAAQSLGELDRGQRATRQDDVFAALIKKLDDRDPFVISRAMEGLRRSDTVSIVEPLIKVATTHPDLAKDAIKTLVNGEHTRQRAIPALRKFASNKDPSIRAAAISGLVTAAPSECKDEVLTALQDKESQVRTSVAGAILALHENAVANDERQSRSTNTNTNTSDDDASSETGFLFTNLLWNKHSKPAESSLLPEERWRQQYREGRERAEWLSATILPLSKMLKSDSADERLAAAMALVPLAHESDALPVLKASATAKLDNVTTIATALPWLLWPQREELFKFLVAKNLDEKQLAVVAYTMARIRSPADIDAVWTLLNPTTNREPSSDLAEIIYWNFADYYEGNNRNLDAPYNALSGGPPRAIAKKQADLKQKIAKGSIPQRKMALALLLNISSDDLAEQAKLIVDDKHAEPSLRATAFRMYLISQTDSAGDKEAIKQLLSQDKPLLRMALMYLSRGKTGLVSMDDEFITSIRSNSISDPFQRNPGVAIEVVAPERLKAEMLGSMLHDGDSEAKRPRLDTYFAH